MTYTRYRFSFGYGLTPAIKKLMILMGVVFLLQEVVSRMMVVYLGLLPALVWHEWYLWQLFTYIFLHGDIPHILFNLLALWMFGGELENLWGSRRFLFYFFFCGIGAGMITVLCTIILTPQYQLVPVIGASGAIYGILLAFGWLFPSRPIYVYFLFPIPAKYFVAIFGFLEFIYFSRGGSGGISHITHLGGLLFGFVYMAYPVIRQKIRREYYKRKWSQKGPRSGGGYYH
jgi:membrane associated rhomboid family serine protease